MKSLFPLVWLLVAGHSWSKGPNVTIILAEREYRTQQTLPAFFDMELKPLGFEASYVRAPGDGEARNNLQGVEKALAEADLLLVSVRRRAPKESQMKAIKDWVGKGKPVVGIRTTNHAFHLRDKPTPKGHAQWEEWDEKVIGGNYSGHHGNKLKTSFQLETKAKKHPILKGLEIGVNVPSGGSLYKVSPLARSTRILAMGKADQVEKREPVAWTNKPEANNRIFFTSLGHVEDFDNPAFRLLLLNAIYWSLQKETPGKLLHAKSAK